MKIKIYIPLILLSIQSVFAQIPFPDLYCNNEKTEDSIFASFFSPVMYEFKFPASDTTYAIKEGDIDIIWGNKSKTFPIKSNSFQIAQTHPGKDLQVTIRKIDLFVNGKYCRTDSTTLSKTFNKKRTEATKKEGDLINTINNTCQIKLNGKLLKPTDYITFKKKSELEVSLIEDNSHKINKVELILVRSIRPVAVHRLIENTGDISRFNQQAQPGDFLFIQVYVEGEEIAYRNKVYFVE